MMVVPGRVENGGSSKSVLDKTPVLTSEDESEDPDRGGDIREDTH